jgi:type VII secretion integral membrane protein EccD
VTTFTRLTVVGSTARAEVVVPSDEPVASISPALFDLLGEDPGSMRRPVTLVRVLGDPVDPLLSLADQGVLDGEIVRAVRSDEAPPPPEVADVTDVVADGFAERHDRWGTRSRLAVASVVVVAASAVVASVLNDAVAVPAAVLSSTVVALLIASIVAGRFDRRGIAVLSASAALGVGVVDAIALERLLPDASAPAVVPLAALVSWIVLGSCFGVAVRQRSARWGALAGLLLWGLAAVLLFTPLPLAASAGILATVSVVALGLLPWFALSTSGLTGLDDGAAAGSLPSRIVVHETLIQAYRALSWAVAAVAVPLALSAVVLVLQDDVYAFCLGVAVAVVASLRTRTFPLALQGVVLWSVPVAVAFAAALSPFPPDGVRLLIVGALLVVTVALATIRPVAHVRVRLRRWGNALELLAMVAVVPLLLGIFGLYADLLETFPAP